MEEEGVVRLRGGRGYRITVMTGCREIEGVQSVEQLSTQNLRNWRCFSDWFRTLVQLLNLQVLY